MTQLKSLRQFREEKGLGEVTPRTSVSGAESERVDDIIDILHRNADKLRLMLTDIVQGGKCDNTELENDLKRLIGLVGALKDGPKERKKTSDPFNNVVARPFAGPDSSGSNDGGGGGEG